MSRVLLLGPILNRNREAIISRCREMLRTGRGHEFLYLAATRPMLDAITARLLDGLQGVLAPPNVFLLSGFSRRLVREARDEATAAPLPGFASIDTDQRPVQRPLMARIVARLAERGALPAFAPLARTDGLVEALIRLVAEIQRAGKTSVEFREAIARRATLQRESAPSSDETPASRDFDADAATVYDHFEAILSEHRLTDGNTDYLRALSVARGTVDGQRVTVPFLDDVNLLVLDGFFDILPVHQELVTSLIRQVPEVIVNLNHDADNPRAFAAHADVVERFTGMAGFEVVSSRETLPVADELVNLRRRLFSDRTAEDAGADDPEKVAVDAEPGEQLPNPRIVEMTAADRNREIRGIAKEIKRLALDEGVETNAVAIVLRNRDAYEPFIREIFADEGVPLATGERRAVTELAAVRAAMKVLDAAVANRTPAGRAIGMKYLVAISKSDYLGVDVEPEATPRPATKNRLAGSPQQLALPWDIEPTEVEPSMTATERWNAASASLAFDELENVAAHVGIDLDLGDWLSRASYLIAQDVLATSREPNSSILDLTALVTSEEREESDENRVDGVDESADVDAGPDSDGAPVATRKRPRLDMPVSTLRRAVGVVTALGEAVLRIPHRAQAVDMAAAFRDALDTLGFRRRLVEAARRAVSSRDALARAAVDLRAIESLDRAIDAVVEAVELTAQFGNGDSMIGRTEFRGDLERALSGNSATLTSDTPGGVRLLGLTDTRGLVFDVVFVPGLVEGEFPARARGDWMYPQSERATYRDKLGLPLEDISPERSLESEEHAFYQAVCRATRRLYLCRPVTTDESETIASPFLDDVRNAIGPIATLMVSSGMDRSTLALASTPAELARGVVYAETRGDGEDDRTGIVAALGAVARSGPSPALTLDAMRRIAIEHRRDHEGFDEFDGLLVRPDLRRLVRNAYAERQFSATNFREYGTCAFRFFARDVLGLEPRTEAALDLQLLDSGNLVHGVLQRFFTLHARTDFAIASRASLIEDLRACASEVFDEFEHRMPPLNAGVWRIERRTLGMQLERFLDAELALQERLSGSRAVERRVEVAFGVRRRDGDSTSVDAALEVPTEGRPIRVVGRIDRIDRTADGSLVAYDYKTGAGSNLRDMEEGRDFQLGIYLEAIERLFLHNDETIVGGAYLTLKDAANRVTNLLANADTPLGDALYGRRKKLGTEGFADVRRRIIDNIHNAVERIADGDFRVAPSGSMRPCSCCDFPSVCRVEPYRIRRKLRADGVPNKFPLPRPDPGVSS